MAVSKKFTVNGKKYDAIDFTFNTVADLEDLGFSLEEASSKSLKFLRAYFALCAGISVKEAGEEIEAHIIGGENLDEMGTLMAKKLDESGFFQSIIKNAQEKNQAN